MWIHADEDEGRLRAGRAEDECKVSGRVSRQQVVVKRQGRGERPREPGAGFYFTYLTA